MEPMDKKIFAMAKTVIKKIMEMKVAKSRVDTKSIEFKPFAQWIKSEIACSEEDFIKALHCVRKLAPSYYDAIDIPPRWDGGAHEQFPHLFLKGEIVKLVALKDIPRFPTDHGDIGPFSEGTKFETRLETAKRLVKRGIANPVDLDLE